MYIYIISMADNLLAKLGLKRSLIVFDTETTGLAVRTDRIVQLAYSKYFTDGRTEQASLLFNPLIPIPASATEVHGITDAMVAEAPTFGERSGELMDVFADCVYSGFNVSGYDLPLLRQEFSRVGMDFVFRAEDIIDAKIIYHALEPRTLSSAYKYYCGKDHDGAHDALADVTAAAEVLSAQIDRYGLEKVSAVHIEQRADSVDSDGKFYWRDGQAHFSFSKFRHQPLGLIAETERGFLDWMLKGDFSDEVKRIVSDALAGKLPKKE